MAKRPAFQFYPGDWLRDTALRSCSIGARGLWIDMLCLMHEGEPYGHLKVSNKIIKVDVLARMVGESLSRVRSWLTELEEAGVYSVDDEDCIYSRRMVRDEALRDSRAAGGKEGGNPKLMGGYNKPGHLYVMQRSNDLAIKIGISKEPSKRLYKIRQQFPGIEVSILAALPVEDMGAAEAELHLLYAQRKIAGEWFALTKDELDSLLAVHLKVKQTPAVAVAVASAELLLPPQVITRTWWPSIETRQDLRMVHGFDPAWIDQQVASFVAYWIDIGEPRPSWDALFVDHCTARAKFQGIA